MLILRSMIVVLVVLTLSAMPGFADDVPKIGADAVEKNRLEKMLADGDTGMIIAVFKRHPGRTLPFIDGYLEGGLAMIEKADPAANDAAAAQAAASFRTGIQFAKLADEAFQDTSFSDYANAFASWSPSEQKVFRQGQRLFREGMKAAKDDPAAPQKALTLFRESLKLADSLGDTWGRAMAQAAIAEHALKVGSEEENRNAHVAAFWAIDLYGKLKLQDDYVQALRMGAVTREALGDKAAGLQFLSQAWNVVKDDPSIDAATRQAVLDDYLAALERNGQKADADRLRKEHGQK
jgi:hypothetical protein